jgi:hypothetical protein
MMKQSKRRNLQRAGFKVGTVQEFLRLSDEEMALIDLKIILIDGASRGNRLAGRLRPRERRRGD